MLLSEFKESDEFQDFFNSCKYGEFALERVLSEECFKHSMIILSLVLPISVAHCELIMVSEKRCDPVLDTVDTTLSVRVALGDRSSQGLWFKSGLDHFEFVFSIYFKIMFYLLLWNL